MDLIEQTLGTAMPARAARASTSRTSPSFTGEGLVGEGLIGEGIAVVAVVLVLPVALYLAGLASLARLAYPVTNLLVAAYLYERRSPWYAAQCLLIFCVVSLIRRLIDDQTGFDASNPVLLTPYLCCLLTTNAFVNYWRRARPRGLGPFLLMFACIAYGAVLAVLDGRVLSVLVDVLKWLVGPLMAIYLLENRDRIATIRALIEPTLIAAGTAMALYGVVQFVEPASWDATWMRGVADLGFDSIGQPEPFAVRVFGTMNSPGSLGTVLLAAMLLSLKRPPLVCVLTIGPMLLAIALCQYRSIWAMTALGVLLVALSPSAALRRANLLMLAVVGMLLASSALIPQVNEAISARASSLSSLEGDESLRLRLKQYEEFFENDDLLVGEGLAINGASRRLDKRATGLIDGAVIEIFTAMGVFVGTAFIAAIVTLIAGLFQRSAAASRHIHFDRAIVLTLFAQFPIGTVHIGELGFCAWMFLGFALATRFANEEFT
jgi:hypothetical protein